MKTPRFHPVRAVLTLAAALGIASLSCVWYRLEHALPVYNGTTLYEWVVKLDAAADHSPARFEDVYAAQSAIRAIGTNALPFALANLNARAASYDGFVGWLAARVPSLNLKPRRLTENWALGVQILDILGPIAEPCLPILIAEATNNPGYSEEALLAVGDPALPALIDLLQNSQASEAELLVQAFSRAVLAGRITREQGAVVLPSLITILRSSNRDLAKSAAGAIGVIHLNPDLCLPLLAEGLSSTSLNLRTACAESIGKFGMTACDYAGQIAAAYDSSSIGMRQAVCKALGEIHCAAQVSVPVLTRALQDSNSMVRFYAAQFLGEFGPLASSAVPALQRLCNDTNEVTRFTAGQSLAAITGEQPGARH